MAVVEQGESGVALSEVEDEGLGLAQANDRLGVLGDSVGVVAVGFDLFCQKPTQGVGVGG